MKIEVIEPGVFDKDGVEIEIGTELQIKGDELPKALVNKVRVIGTKKGKKSVTNRDNDAPSADMKKQADELGIEYGDDTTAVALQAAIDAKLAE